MSRSPSRSGPVIRTFVAIHVPADIQRRLADVAGSFRDRLPGKSARWARPENIHLTLRFIGNVSPQDVEALRVVLQASVRGGKPFTLELGKPGCFPDAHRPRVLWVGVEGDVGPLMRLQSSVSQAAAAWAGPEDRVYHPHLTLGRVVARTGTDLQTVADPVPGSPALRDAVWHVDAIHLMQSDLMPPGPKYSTLASFPLIG